MNSKQSLIAGGLFGFLAVAFGAFGAHALRPILMETNRLETYELASRYLFYHAFGLIALGMLQHIFEHNYLKWSAVLMLSGVLIFSGSLYILSLTGITKFGMITPIGGISLLAGWAFLVAGVIKGK